MAIKVVQKVKRITANASTPTLSDPIALKSGYLRVSTGSTPVYVETGIGTPVANVDSFHLGPYGNEVLKERIARQRIVGITTGASTVVLFDNNAGNPFLVGDYASIEGVTTAGINTEHKEVTEVYNDSLVLNYDTSSVTEMITTTGASIARSVKVSVLAATGEQPVSITEIVQLVTE